MKFSSRVANGMTAAVSFLVMPGAISGRRQKIRWSARLMLAGVICLLGATASAATLWTIKDLGTLGGTSSFAQGINDSGDVVGQAATGGNAASHAFLLRDGGIMKDLGGVSSRALGVNNARVAVGFGSASPGGTIFPFIYKNGVMANLGNASGRAWAVNDAGDIVGDRLNSAGIARAFLYRRGGFTDLGTLGGSSSGATAINGAGHIVGSSATSGDSAAHAFLYNNRGMADLGTLGGSFSGAYGVNDKGEVVGDSTINGDNIISHAFLFQGNRMRDLGTLGGPFSQALAINNAGHVVGISLSTATGPFHAFLYHHGVMTDLNALPAVQAAGWLLETANAVNNDGQIVGSGIINGETHAYRLTPTHESEKCDDDRDGRHDHDCDAGKWPFGRR